MSEIVNLGKVSMTMGGDWDSSKSYEKLTCVSHNGRSWASKKNVSAGIEPSEANSAFWQKMSERGIQGIQGPVGPQGNSAFDGTGVEIVNNLTQGGESAVLSAEQGKVLKTELTELESEVYKTIDISNVVTNGIYAISNRVEGTMIQVSEVADASWRKAKIEVRNGELYRLTGQGGGKKVVTETTTETDLSGNYLGGYWNTSTYEVGASANVTKTWDGSWKSIEYAVSAGEKYRIQGGTGGANSVRLYLVVDEQNVIQSFAQPNDTEVTIEINKNGKLYCSTLKSSTASVVKIVTTKNASNNNALLYCITDHSGNVVALSDEDATMDNGGVPISTDGVMYCNFKASLPYGIAKIERLQSLLQGAQNSIENLEKDIAPIKEAKETIIPLKFGKLSDGRIDLPTTVESYDDMLYHLRSSLYKINGVSKILAPTIRDEVVVRRGYVLRVAPASDSTIGASVGEAVTIAEGAVGGWQSSQFSVKAGETYRIAGLASGGRIPLIAVINSANVLTQKIEGTQFSDNIITIAEDGLMVINQTLKDSPVAYRFAAVNVTYHYYDENRVYLGANNNTIPPKAKFVRLSMSQNSPFHSELSVIQPTIGCLIATKEDGNRLDNLRAYYPVNLHNPNAANEAEDILQDESEMTYDVVKLILPPNYKPDGEPVRLVIYVQGSGGSIWSDRSFNGADNLRAFYVAQEGYMLMMINGITAKYHALYPEVNDNFGTPITMSCYLQAYKWVLDNYNVRADGVFTYGKSLGGIGVGNLMYSQIPILAAAGLAPALDCISEIMRNRDAQAKQYYADSFGMVGDITFSDRPVAWEQKKKEEAYFKANAHKVVGYNPLWNGVIGLNTDTLLDASFQHGVVDTGQEYADERQAYESLPKYQPCPLKIWIAHDDVNVDPRFCDYLRAMVRKAGCIYELRWMPSGTGGHWAVDKGSEVNGVYQAPVSATIKPRYSSETITMAVAVIEMVTWFRRFES